ncbi:unnamed protein product [Camellia sinensis]
MFPERQPISTSAQGGDKDYMEPSPAPLFEPRELTSWSFYRAGIAEFMATFLFLYITILMMMEVVSSKSKCSTVGIQGIAWSFGGMIFALVYCTAGISGGHINPAVIFGLLLARKLSLTRAVFYMVTQCLGAFCGAAVAKGFEGTTQYKFLGGGANFVNHGYTKGYGLGAEIVGTFVLVYTVFFAIDAKRSVRDSHVPSGVHHALNPDPYRGVFGSDREKYARDVEDLITFGTSGHVAGFISETIQRVGGIIELAPGYFPAVYSSIKKAGGLCIADEVQFGFAHTGSHFWRFETQGIVLDIVTMAKFNNQSVILGKLTWVWR